MLIGGRWAGGPSSAAELHPSHPTPQPLGGRAVLRALRPLPIPPQGLQGELQRSGRQLDWEGSCWLGARLISC